MKIILISLILLGCATHKLTGYYLEKDRLVVGEILNKNLEFFEKCYDKALTKDKSIKGTVKLQFVISPEGVVRRPMVLTPLPANLKACLISELKQIQFPEVLTGKSLDIRQSIQLYQI